MIAISVVVDRAAALLRGHDLGDRVTVEVSPETIGADLWPVLVADLQTAHTPPTAMTIRVAEATPQAVRDCLAARVAGTRQTIDRVFASLRSQVAARREAVAAAPKRVPCNWQQDTRVPIGQTFEGYRRDLPYVATYYSANAALSGAEGAEWSALANEAIALEKASNDEIKSLNEAACSAALPAMLEAHAAAQAKLQAETEAAEQTKAIRIAERAAARLASGYWERETSGYNDRRYGAPWCAKVTGIKARGELVYEWGDSTARHGAAGLLRVPCKPGEIIAWGQKDLRKPAGNDHYILRMLEDGRMETIDRTEAYRRLTA
jgi:hypothetical protein